MTATPEEYLADWKLKEEIAEAMLPLIGRLYRNRNVITFIYGRKVVQESAISILKAHRNARQWIGSELKVQDTYPVLVALCEMDISPARVDLGKLATQYYEQGNGLDLSDFLEQKLAPVLKRESTIPSKPGDVVLYGFGRIGRLIARNLIARTGSGHKLRLRAVVVRPSDKKFLHKRASLLRRDSVHGPFNGTIQVDEEKHALVVNGNLIQFIYADGPDQIDYTAYGINDALVIDNTGKWRDEEGLGLHLKSKGINNVLLTAPGKGSIKNIIYGVNHDDISSDDQLLSAASCTTNAIVPPLKVINDRYEIINGHVETIHAYTNDQNLIDNFHKKERRGRGAPLNLVLTETGAATAVVKALPELEGKITGNAIRVPTPNVSLAILNLNLAEETTKEELNAYLYQISLQSDLRDQIDYTQSSEVVSSDLVGTLRTGIVDSKATIAMGNRCTVYVWYDNEAGYSNQVVRIAQQMTGLHYPSLP